MTATQVLILIPTYNEAENIEAIILALLGVATELPDYNLDILVIDDNSPDGTPTIVRTLMQRHTNVRLITGKKQGLGKAYIRGFKYALKQGDTYDALVMMDADFSHNPVAIPSMLAKLTDSEDYVIGSRYVTGGTIPGNWPLLRILNSRVANFMAHALVGIDKRVTDVTGGYKALRLSALANIDLRDIQSAGYFFQVNLLHAFLEKGYSVAEVPITFVDRRFGVSKLRFKDITEFLYRAYKLNPDSTPRRLVRFCSVGATGTVVNLAVIALLINLFKISPFIADPVAIEVSIISNFILNHNYTFRFSHHKDSGIQWRSKLLKFNAGALGGALLSFLIFSLIYRYGGAHYIIADLCGILVSTGWNFWVSTKYVWRSVDAGA